MSHPSDHPAVLRRDRRLPDPFLQPPHRFVVPFLDLAGPARDPQRFRPEAGTPSSRPRPRRERSSPWRPSTGFEQSVLLPIARRLRCLLKYFSSSSSVIDSTTGRPWGHVNRSRRLAPVGEQPAGSPRAPGGSGSSRPTGTRGSPPACRASLLASAAPSSGEPGENFVQRLGGFAVGRLRRQRGDGIGASRHRLDLEAGGGEARRSGPRGSRPPRGVASKSARSSSRCERTRPGGDAVADALVEDPLVRGVLVEDQQALRPRRQDEGLAVLPDRDDLRRLRPERAGRRLGSDDRRNSDGRPGRRWRRPRRPDVARLGHVALGRDTDFSRRSSFPARRAEYRAW